MSTLTYTYKAKPWIMLLVIVFFGACAAILTNTALTNDRGLVLKGFIKMSENTATVFYWVIAVSSAAFVVLGLYGLVNSFKSPKHIVVGPHDISAPRSALSKVIITIPYSEIVDLKDTKVQKQTFFAIVGQTTKVSISQSAMASKTEFSEMRAAVIERSRRNFAP